MVVPSKSLNPLFGRASAPTIIEAGLAPRIHGALAREHRGCLGKPCLFSFYMKKQRFESLYFLANKLMMLCGAERAAKLGFKMYI